MIRPRTANGMTKIRYPPGGRELLKGSPSGRSTQYPWGPYDPLRRYLTRPIPGDGASATSGPREVNPVDPDGPENRVGQRLQERGLLDNQKDQKEDHDTAGIDLP